MSEQKSINKNKIINKINKIKTKPEPKPASKSESKSKTKIEKIDVNSSDLISSKDNDNSSPTIVTNIENLPVDQENQQQQQLQENKGEDQLLSSSSQENQSSSTESLQKQSNLKISTSLIPISSEEEEESNIATFETETILLSPNSYNNHPPSSPLSSENLLLLDHGPDSIIKSLENQADLFFNNNNEGDNDNINTLELTKEVKIEQDNQVDSTSTNPIITTNNNNYCNYCNRSLLSPPTMAQNLEYSIVHATGWDENYPPQQLLPKSKNITTTNNKSTDNIDNNNNNNTNAEIGIKHGKGWQSEKFCSYPQEIILQVTCGPARIRKLQILSHHYKIASKLEIYVGSVQRRKEVVGGMANNVNNNDIADVKRTISWDKMPKIIENDGMCSSDEDGEDAQDDDFVITTATNHNDTSYDLIKMNGEPYIHFKKLGYFALDSNERANYKAREFKSVRLDVDGEYIRLVARKCYTNHLNQYNQVGIVGITVMGEPANYLLAGESTKIPIENADDGVLTRVASPDEFIVPIFQERCYQPHDQRNFGSLYSLLQDSSSSSSSSSSSCSDQSISTTDTSISTVSTTNESKEQPEISTVKRKLKDYLTANDFLQNQNETTRLLLAFDKAKKNAVKVEDFPLAKVLKYSVELMKRGVEEVAKLDVLKQEAVEVEDFDNADKYKREIEAVRDEMRTALSDEGLDIDDQDEVMVYDPQLDPQLQDIIGLADDNNYNDDNNNNSSNKFNNNNNVQSMTMNQSHYHSSWMLKQQSNLQQQLQITDYIEEEPEELSNLARSAFTLSIQFFGDFLIASLLSKKFKLRELALNEIRKRVDYSISSDDNNDPSDDNVDDVLADKIALVKASYQVIQEGLNDNQEKLLTLTLSLWESTINYSIYNQIPISSTYKLVEQTYPSLFTKITESDTTTDVTASPSKIKQVSMDLLILLIKTYQNSNHSLMENLILKPAKTPSQPSKQAKAKIEIVMQLIDEFGVSMLTKEKLKLHHKHQQQLVKMGYEYLMELSLSYLNNNNADAREMAVKLVFEVIKRVGKQLIEPYFVNNRNVKYPNLIEDIWKLVTEHETVNGEIIQRPPTPDPIITKPKNEEKEASKVIADPTAPLSTSPNPELSDTEVLELTEEELRELEELERLQNFEIDQSLLSKPLAKRGTVTRIEQQLMELRSMANNTNNIINEDYDSYLANSMKQPYHQDEEVVEEEEEEEEEDVKSQAASNKPSPPSSKKSSNSNRNATKTSSSNSTASSNKSKKSNTTSSNAQSTKKTSAVKSKSSVSSANNTNKSASRRGSTDDTKAGPKGTKKSSSKNADAESLPNEADKEDYSDRCCIFCDEQNNDFTEENLVIHYWNECPLLTKCHLCNIILEISTLDEHMLKDCDKSKFVKQCQRCREIIQADDYLEHMAKQACMAIRPDIVRCPLCKTVIKPATEAGWKAHLLDVNGCPKNRRKIKSDGEHNDGDCGAVATTNTNTATKESPSPIKKRSKATTGDSPKSAATKSSGSTTSRKTTGAAATTTTGKTKKTTSSSTTKVSRVKK